MFATIVSRFGETVRSTPRRNSARYTAMSVAGPVFVRSLSREAPYCPSEPETCSTLTRGRPLASSFGDGPPSRANPFTVNSNRLFIP